ncbi:MAG: glycosyltransferase family 2 protein [Candidatus Aminicenantes bacterium]|nr:glycosyltransferase family 2 protein [Candidatus Aminicenantes bacterium]
MIVSIIIPVYNAEKYIARCIRSAMNQSLNKELYEIIVINDGSSDNTAEVLKYLSSHITLINLDSNMGIAYARNEGIKASRGRYIVNLDADDYIDRELLYVESMFLNMNPEWDAVSCDYILVDEKESHIQRVNSRENPIACGIMFRVERLIDIGLYDPKFMMNEDMELRIRFEKKFAIKHIELPLYRYRQHESNSSKDLKKKEKFGLLLKRT